MIVTVHCFARAREIIGKETCSLELPEAATIADLKTRLVEEHPGLQSLSAHLLCSIGTDYVTDERPLSSGDKVAVFPPVSGG